MYKVLCTHTLFDTHKIVDEVTLILSVFAEGDEENEVGIVVYREHAVDHQHLDSFTYYGQPQHESAAIFFANKFVQDLGPKM